MSQTGGMNFPFFHFPKFSTVLFGSYISFKLISQKLLNIILKILLMINRNNNNFELTY